MSLHIRTKGQGHPLVLFHGFGFDSSIWSPIESKLSSKYQLYLVDLPGFGRSELMPWDEFSQKLYATLPNQFALLGWSMGGLYATKMAYESPSRVSHLINIASIIVKS